MGAPTTAFSSKTLAQMRAAVYSGLNRKPTDAMVSTASVNDAIAKWDAFFVEYAKWNYAGYRKTKILSYFTRTTLKSDLGTADVSVELTSNASIPSSGRMSVNRDEVDYSGKDTPNAGYSVTVASTKTPDVSHVAGEMVEFLTPMPTDCGKPGELWYMGYGNSPGSRLKHVDWRDDYWPPSGRYTTKDGYLYLPAGYSSSNLQLQYWKKGMKLIEGDSLQCPEKWDNFVKWCAMADILMNLKEYAEATKLYAMSGAPTENKINPIGLIQTAAAQDAEQTNSQYEVFDTEVVSLDLP